MAESKRRGGASRKVAGLCVLCRVSVRDPIRHYTSDGHQSKVRADAKRRAGNA